MSLWRDFCDLLTRHVSFRKRRRSCTRLPASWRRSRQSWANPSCTTHTATFSDPPWLSPPTTSWGRAALVKIQGKSEKCRNTLAATVYSRKGPRSSAAVVFGSFAKLSDILVDFAAANIPPIYQTNFIAVSGWPASLQLRSLGCHSFQISVASSE